MPLHFKPYTKADILAITHVRKFETKLGEMVKCSDNISHFEDAIAKTTAAYIVIGVPEDIGVKANAGKGGADSSWFSFLDSFLNIQSNDFFSGEQVFVAGHFDFGKVKNLINANAATDGEKMEAYRHAVNMIDEEVEEIIKMVTENKKIPIVIGGGHNNAYAAIKGSAKGLFKADLLSLAQISCINLDAHADYRPLEGRHSGNAFRYADNDGYLKKYFILCIHENYLQQNTWMDVANNPFINCITYEDVFIRENKNFMGAISNATAFVDDEYTGIELDLDSIENILSSAVTPCGITNLQARQFMNLVAANVKIAYLHICEGATRLETGETDSKTGKLISYLVSDFIKAYQSR
ncbi:MAG: arginase family protein [Bacteroidota bacterium]|nr:arginase family protein [Bacteroidota bacterium]